MDTPEPDEEWSAHFVGALGLEMWVEDGLTHGRATVRPEMWAPGTSVPRLGVLATMVDVVCGTLPDELLNPTVDMRVTLVSRPPSEGEVSLVCRPAKRGSRLYVGECVLYTGDVDRPFARATATFLNHVIGFSTFDRWRPAPPARMPTFDELLGARFLDTGVVEMDAHPRVSNGPGGTIQGGAQALLGEIAAEHALAPRGNYATVDLDIRYLNRVRTPSAIATAELLDGDLGSVSARVPIRESGADGRLVSVVTTLCREL